MNLKNPAQQKIILDPIPYGERIPKILHQSYTTTDFPEEIGTNIQRLKKLNPDWEYRFYDDEDIEHYLERHFPQTLPLFRRISPQYGAARADFFRYLLMYREGGVYLDIKSSLTKPLDEVLNPDDSFILSQWQNDTGEKYEGWGLYEELNQHGGEFQQWFIVSVPGHPFLHSVICNVFKNIIKYHISIDNFGQLGVFRVTGPIAFTKAIVPILKNASWRFVDAEDELGFIYSIYQDGTQSGHHQLFKQHYSKQKGLIIRNNMWRNLQMWFEYHMMRLNRIFS